jgi:prepilin-type processing-associated H-X9-DG protein
MGSLLYLPNAAAFRGLSPGDLNNPCDQWHYYSLHPGGANFCMGDASVRFLSYTTSPKVQRALATRAGGEPVDVPLPSPSDCWAKERETSVSRGRRPNPQRRRLIAQLRADGMTYEQIGAQLGVSHQAVQQILQHAGNARLVPIHCRGCDTIITRLRTVRDHNSPVYCRDCLPADVRPTLEDAALGEGADVDGPR